MFVGVDSEWERGKCVDTAAGHRERKGKLKGRVSVYAHVCLCVSPLSSYTYYRPAGVKVFFLPEREYGNNVCHEDLGINIWKGSFGDEARDRL